MVSAGLMAVGAAGGLVLLVVLADIFVTIFNYDGFTFLAGRMHRSMWWGLRRLAWLLPASGRHGLLSLGSALMLPATLVGWLALEISAFAMMFLPGLAAGQFTLGDHVRPEIGTAFYLSAGAISSLTFGDVLARTSVYPALIDVETIVGWPPSGG